MFVYSAAKYLHYLQRERGINSSVVRTVQNGCIVAEQNGKQLVFECKDECVSPHTIGTFFKSKQNVQGKFVINYQEM